MVKNNNIPKFRKVDGKFLLEKKFLIGHGYRYPEATLSQMNQKFQ